MQRVLAACAGFLLAVLWFDLMFDVQVLAHPTSEPLPEPVLASIAAYYRRVTSESGMSGLVAFVMFTTFGGAAWQGLRGSGPLWRRGVAFVLGGGAIGLAILRILPDAMRLGARTDPLSVQSQLARGICTAHLACFAAIAVFLALQLAVAGPRVRSGREGGG